MHSKGRAGCPMGMGTHCPQSQAGLFSKSTTPRTDSHIPAVEQPMGTLYWCISQSQLGGKD